MKLTREQALKAIMLPALAAAVGVTAAPADAKVSQGAAKYQNHPKRSQECDRCTFYLPGKTATANGQCKIVGGAISPKGWCTFFNGK